MTDKEEGAYIEGNLAAYRAVLMECARGLGRGDPLADAAAMMAELHDARAALRRICARHGDNDWSDSLNLADVIDKHLGRHLGE